MPALPRLRLLLTAVAVGVVPAGCTDGPAPGPGTLAASLVSPHGAEGAAVLELVGPGIEGVSGGAGARVWGRPGGGDTVAVVVVADQPGALTFRVAVADTLLRPEVRVVEVAGPDDALRGVLAGYRVELTP